MRQSVTSSYPLLLYAEGHCVSVHVLSNTKTNSQCYQSHSLSNSPARAQGYSNCSSPQSNSFLYNHYYYRNCQSKQIMSYPIRTHTTHTHLPAQHLQTHNLLRCQWKAYRKRDRDTSSGLRPRIYMCLCRRARC
jgi:hypothetical protein